MSHDDLKDSFFKMNDTTDLCDILNITVRQLRYILFVREKNYIEFEIPKKRGGTRKIKSPKKDLKYIQKQLSKVLAEVYDFLDVQHGFIRNKSCVTNASNHVNKRFILNIDLKDFFTTIHFGRVQGLFMHEPFNFNKYLATMIAKLVCEDGYLPQGAPTSPIISNIICYVMDNELNYIANKNRCVYTRYADDITFSTNSDVFPRQIAQIVDRNVVLSNRLLQIISGGFKTGFKVNESKTKISKKMFRQEVTGLIVNEKTNVKKEFVRNLRANLHQINNIGFLEYGKIHYPNLMFTTEREAKNKLFNELQGKLNYLKMVRGYNDKVFLKYAKQFNEIFEVELFDIDAIKKLEDYSKERCYVVQEKKYESSQGTGFATEKGIFTSTHILINPTTHIEFIYDKKHDKYLTQFPMELGDGKLPFFKIYNFTTEKILNYEILQADFESDILLVKNAPFSKEFKISNNGPKILQKVYMIGYPKFLDFNTTSIHIIETIVIGKDELFGRKFFKTQHNPPHGMSGGPVLNEHREVIGIVYAGADLSDDYSTESTGFISLI